MSIFKTFLILHTLFIVMTTDDSKKYKTEVCYIFASRRLMFFEHGNSFEIKAS